MGSDEIDLLAEQGDAEAQWAMGADYFFNAPEDHAEAVKWFRLAAEQGQVGAQFNLGVCYTTGRGVSKDQKEAERWLALALAQNNENLQKFVNQMLSSKK